MIGDECAWQAVNLLHGGKPSISILLSCEVPRRLCMIESTENEGNTSAARDGIEHEDIVRCIDNWCLWHLLPTLFQPSGQAFARKMLFFGHVGEWQHARHPHSKQSSIIALLVVRPSSYFSASAQATEPSLYTDARESFSNHLFVAL